MPHAQLANSNPRSPPELRSRNRDPKRLPGGPDVRKHSHEATVRAPYAEAPSLVLVRCISPLRPESPAFGLACDSAVIGPKARNTRQAGPACTLATTVCVASIVAEVGGVRGRGRIARVALQQSRWTPPLASHCKSDEGDSNRGSSQTSASIENRQPHAGQQLSTVPP